MSTYRAWDGNDYPSPPPEGWYQGSDELWWPEGYGPGPAPQAADPAPAPEPTPAPAPAPAPVAEPAPSTGATAAPYAADPTTVMPTPAAPGSIGATPPPAFGTPPPAQAPSAFDSPRPGGFDPSSPEPMDWSQPPGSTPPPGAGPAPSDSSSGSSKVGLLIGLAALIFVLIFGGLAYLLLGSDDTEPVAFDASAPAGSAANPHAAGDVVRLSFADPDSGASTEWTIQVVSAPVDTSPGGDDAQATVGLQVSLDTADGPKSLSDLSFTSVAADGSKTSSGGCDAVVSPLPEDRSVAVGETVEGEVCWEVPATDLASLAMMVEVEGIDGQVHLKLQ